MQNAPHQLCIGHVTNFANMAKRTIGALLAILHKDVPRHVVRNPNGNHHQIQS